MRSVTVLIAFLLTIENGTLNKEVLTCHESILRCLHSFRTHPNLVRIYTV